MVCKTCGPFDLKRQDSPQCGEIVAIVRGHLVSVAIASGIWETPRSSEEDPLTQPVTGCEVQTETSIAQDDIDPKNNASDFDEDFTTDVDFETSSQARSTLVDALHCPARVENFENSEDSSNSTATPVCEARKPGPLSGSSRAKIKQSFSETTPISFPVGHPTAEFKEAQIGRGGSC